MKKLIQKLPKPPITVEDHE